MLQIVIDRESHKLLRAVSVTQDSDKCNNKIIAPFWQGRRESNTQPMVLETTTLPVELLP